MRDKEKSMRVNNLSRNLAEDRGQQLEGTPESGGREIF